MTKDLANTAFKQLSFKDAGVMLIVLFFACSTVGWVYETIDNIIRFNALYLRELWILPWCPIYGVGGLILAAILVPMRSKLENATVNKWLVVAAIAVTAYVVTTAIELGGSYICEMTMGSVPWDYSTAWLNFDGRVAPEYTVKFVIFAFVEVWVLWPALLKTAVFEPSRLTAIALACTVLAVFDITLENAGVWSDVKMYLERFGVKHW